jgi:hypothetical protein
MLTCQACPSATWIASIGATAGLKADFGAGTWNGGPIGIPYTTVSGTQARVPVSFSYADESDACGDGADHLHLRLAPL